MDNRFEVTAGAGTMMSASGTAVRLLAVVDQVAEIPRAIRAGATVQRIP